MLYGVWGSVLEVDLTSRIISKKNIEESIYKKFLGGAGLGAQILYSEVNKEVKAFDPENRIIFAVGPFQGSNLPGSGKWNVISKSPLTGIFADSSAGSMWGIMLKQAGYDALVIKGKSQKPVYLLIIDDKVEIKDASHIWGKDSFETCDVIIKELGIPKVSIACIGPAGERLVCIANIVVDKQSFAARCGLGAVMGSKNLKGVVVKGTKKVELAKPEQLNSLAKELREKIRPNTEAFSKHGTPVLVVPTERLGDLPIKYWTGDTWEDASKIGAPYYTKILGVKQRACACCPIGCHRHIKIEEPLKYALEGAGPEYESLAMLGSCCLVNDLKAICKANDLCNRYGIDTISAGAMIGFSMECYEKGLLTKEDTEGLELEWGKGDIMIELVRQIGEKRGKLGELFAQGIVKASKVIGHEAEDIALHVKGLDIPAHDPRAFFSDAINYATGTRGACHMRGNPRDAEKGLLLPEVGITQVPARFTMEGKAYITAKFQDLCTLYNSLTGCNFMMFGKMTITDITNGINAITGWDFDTGELMKTAERIFTLQRLFDVICGVSRKDDKLPNRMFQPAKTGGRANKIPVPFDSALEEYYKLRGWDIDGRPSLKKLLELGLNDK